MGPVTIFLDDAAERALAAASRSAGVDRGQWLAALVRRHLEAPGSLLPKPILLVEDEPTCREALREEVECLGWRADTAVDGAEALALLVRGSYSLLLTDGRMPVMDGFQLARAVRAVELRRGGGRLPIVAVTGEASGESERAGRQCGIDEYLRKPLEAGLLASVLERWLGPAPGV